MTTPTLPIRYEIRNTGVAASSSSMQAICSTVISEGGYNPRGVIRSVDTTITAKAMSTTLIPLLQIRLKSSHIRSTADIISTSIFSADVARFRWALILNPSVAGGVAAVWNSVTNSAIEYDLTATGTVSGGTQIASGYYFSSNQSANFNLPALENSLTIAADIAGTSDVLILACQTTTGAANLFGTLSWKEYN